MRYSARMANTTKSIEKANFRPRSRGTRPRAAATVHPHVVVGRSPIPTATGLADRLGWLEREAALDGTPLTVSGDSSTVAGRLREGESTRALWERSESRPTRLIGLTWVETYRAVVALPETGITHPAQLAGRRLALPRDEAAAIDVRRADARRGIHAAIALAGLFPDEIVQVDVDASDSPADPYGAELEALTRGEVDAVFLAGAAGVAAAACIGATQVAGVGRHLDPAVRISATTPATITVDAELLERHPNLVVRLLAVLLRAGAWAQLNAPEATRLLAAETGTSPRHVKVAHGGGWPDQLQVDLSQRKLDALGTQHDFLLTHGYLRDVVDLGAWIDPRPLGVALELLAAERTSWTTS
jgi:ABC-type nitrate/sulfonate/bicarbonate transport system substrate-binding protein